MSTTGTTDVPKFSRPRWYAPTLAKLLVALLVMQGVLFLSAHYRWFWFNERKGWTVLIAVAATATFLILAIVWGVIGRFVRAKRPSQFSLATLLLLVPVIAIPCGWLAREMQMAQRQEDLIVSKELLQNPYENLGVPDWLKVKLRSTFFADRQGITLNHATDDDLETLEIFPKLRYLELTGCADITDDGLRHLAGLRELEALKLSETFITDAGLQHLAGHAQLQWIELDGIPVTDASLALLKTLPRLETLNLNLTCVTDAGLTQLKDFPRLKKLNLGRTRITDDGLVHLSGLSQLRHLELGETRVGDAGIEYLKGLDELQTLDLDHTNVTSAGLQHLAGLTQLERLWLTGTQVGDAGLAHLRHSHLEQLGLGKTGVTDAGIEHLIAMPQLEIIILSGTQVTAEGAEKLRRAFPKGVIELK